MSKRKIYDESSDDDDLDELGLLIEEDDNRQKSSNNHRLQLSNMSAVNEQDLAAHYFQKLDQITAKYCRKNSKDDNVVDLRKFDTAKSSPKRIKKQKILKETTFHHDQQSDVEEFENFGPSDSDVSESIESESSVNDDNSDDDDDSVNSINDVYDDDDDQNIISINNEIDEIDPIEIADHQTTDLVSDETDQDVRQSLKNIIEPFLDNTAQSISCNIFNKLFGVQK